MRSPTKLIGGAAVAVALWAAPPALGQQRTPVQSLPEPVPGNLLSDPGAESPDLVWAPSGIEAVTARRACRARRRRRGVNSAPAPSSHRPRRLDAADGPLKGPVHRLGFGGPDEAGARALMQIELLDAAGATVSGKIVGGASASSKALAVGSIERHETGGGGALHERTGAIYDVPETVA